MLVTLVTHTRIASRAASTCPTHCHVFLTHCRVFPTHPAVCPTLSLVFPARSLVCQTHTPMRQKHSPACRIHSPVWPAHALVFLALSPAWPEHPTGGVCWPHAATQRVGHVPADGGVRTAVSFLQEREVCEENRDPSRTTTPAGGLRL